MRVKLMNTMPLKGIITGFILIAMAVGGYFLTGAVSKTAFIPAIPGLLILLSSLIAIKKLKLGMHFAALFALLGAIAPLGRVIPTLIKGTFEFNVPMLMTIAMGVICAVFLVLCVKSFIQARRNKVS